MLTACGLPGAEIARRLGCVPFVAACETTAAAIGEIAITLSSGAPARFAVSRCERSLDACRCGVVKDAGDDPDCTHGAEIVAEVSLREAPGVEVRGGAGVATVTKPGLGLEVGAPAINPVPRRNIVETCRRCRKRRSSRQATTSGSATRRGAARAR
jgi:cobalamin biosynthesis protein CbiD